MICRSIHRGPARSRAGGRGLALGLAVLLAGVAPAPADTFRVKAGRGTFLVEVLDAEVTVRGEGDDLVVARPRGDEVRLRPEGDGADRSTAEPLLEVRREGKAIVTVRRVSTPPNPFADGPGKTVLGPKFAASAWSLAITPDGKTLVTGHQGFIRVWDLATLAERFNVPTGRTVRRVDVTPDGLTIASAEYQQGPKTTGNVVVRDGKSGQVRFESKGINTGVNSVALSPDGQVAVATFWGLGEIRVWDARTGAEAGELKGHTAAVPSAVFSPDGKTLASAGDTTVRLWDVDTGETTRTLRGATRALEAVAFSRDGKLVGAGGFDDTARVWDAATGKLLATLEHDHPVLSVAFSPDGKTLATANARWGSGNYGPAPTEVRLWDLATAKAVATLPGQPNQVFAMAFTPDGKSLITASLSGAVTLWDLATFRGGRPR